MINVNRLRSLATVAAHGSIARAAHALHVTPSGMSQQLAALERETGHRLLEPHGRSVRLTHAGRVLVAHTTGILARVAAAESDLADLEDEILGPLRLGAVGSAIRTLLPQVLATLTEQNPRLTPMVRDGEVVEMMPLLLNGDLDMLLIESWASRPVSLPEGLTLRELVSEEAYVALSEHHPLSRRSLLDLRDLEGAVWASCPPGTDSYEALVQALRACGIEPDVRYRVADYSTQLALVETNLTVALVPLMAQRSAPPTVRFVPLRVPLRRNIQAAWCVHAQTPAVRACVAALTAACDQ